MNEFLAIVDELAAWESLSAEADQQARYDSEPTLARSLEKIKAELLNVSVLTAVTTSVLNALERKPLGNTLASAVSDFLPTHSAFFTSSSEQVIAECADTALCASLRDYTSRLQFALMMNRHFTGKIAIRPEDAADVEILSDAWRRACKATAALNASINKAIGLNADTQAPDSEAWIIGILLKAEHGGTPCVDEQGDVTIPGWAERRREKRVRVGNNARATIGNRAFDGKILDASLNGLSFSGKAENGQAVTITLTDGREISGSVVWCELERFGVRFHVPLPAGDPLIQR